ncbi:probable flavin-containing monooxygenase 1 [Ricinus communis]|uniref:Flavin-containing monooxygenase n=1 Tax=Ricinus communis TaxID=3988 RepID=B9RR00_RICCO|nr:probable flavin-containing monooxygenase 1 [Ricinus communis]EEF46171.1 dimethylaniline monooxygenase, putative [Ricinus communis]|eukprot:XP_002516169.1 probable flavin-containing monooxygenase 1 [Ricinus communis]
MASEQNCLQTHKVGIIGAGISGIAAAKQLSHYSPMVFEATGSIGGVWKHCSFTSTRLQTPRCDFEFSDFPWPERDNSSFPSHEEILEYLRNYATHFDVLKFVKFNSRVVAIRHVGETTKLDVKPGEYGALFTGHPVWEVAVQTDQSHDVQWYGFELLVVCIGKYGDVKRMPVFPPYKGEEAFGGKVLHSMDYSKLDKDGVRDLLQGKKVAIVGYKKSAIDLAVECAMANQGPKGQPCTVVIRTLHWTVPSYWIWGLPFFFFFSTRSSQFLHERPNQSCFKTLLCLLLSPMRKAISKFVESYLAWKLPLVKYGLKPDHPFVEDYASCQMAILPEQFFPEADKGNILFKRTSKWWFWNGGIEFEDHTKLEADVVLLATGYEGRKKLQDLLPQPFSSLMIDSSGIMPLYRGTIHPLIPNMAFVGYIESVSNLHTAELRCIWLARLAEDRFRLPSIGKMIEQTTEEIEIMKRTTRFYKRHCISTYSINHSDEICEEMGWNPWRKRNLFLEAFSPYNSQDYQEKKDI